MSLNSYKMSREYSYSNPQKEMLREKKMQIYSLFDISPDREDNILLNGENFNKSPRIFDMKQVDTVHTKITVETLKDYDLIECGDYIEYNGMYWLCLHSYNFHDLYYRATFMSCNTELFWCTPDGEIKSIWCVDINSTQYGSGENEGKIMTLGSAQHILKMQCNDDTVKFDTPMRFYLDRNIENPTCYKVTQNDNTAYNYGKGLCSIVVTQYEKVNEKDKLVLLSNGKKVWIADYTENDENKIENKEYPFFSSQISYRGTKQIIAGGSTKTFNAVFEDKDGNKIDFKDYTWKCFFNDNFSDCLSMNITNSNQCKVKIAYTDLIVGETLKVAVFDLSGNEIMSENIEIGGGL